MMLVLALVAGCGGGDDQVGSDDAGISGNMGGSGGSAGSAPGGSGGAGGMGGAGGPSFDAGAAGNRGAGGSGGSSSSMNDASFVPADGGSAGAGAGDGCTRQQLTEYVDGYFAALADHDPSSLPLASGVRLTENGETMAVGEGVLWEQAGALDFGRNVLDTERCGTLTQGVMDIQGTATIIGVRLQLEAAMITEIESYVVDPEDGFVPTPEGVSEDGGADWESILPEEERSSRDTLNAAADAYFDLFSDSSTEVPFGTPCDRFENGFQTTSGQCSTGFPAGGVSITDRRYPIADLEAGIAVGFVRFNGMLDFHMFKVRNGQIVGIQALVGPSATSSGWE